MNSDFPEQEMDKLIRQGRILWQDTKIEGILYFAAPFYSEDESIRYLRIRAIEMIVSKYISLGKVCFSPITYTSHFNETSNPPQGWYAFDLNFLKVCSALVVITLKGWKSSKGVQMEIASAYTLGIPIFYITSAELKRLGVNNSFIMPDSKDEII